MTQASTAHGPAAATVARRLPADVPRRALAWASVFATLLALAAHALFFASAGGLWRDEVCAVNTATMPTWAALWGAMEFESFPILYFALLRGWASLFGTSDVALRSLGMLVGTGLLAAIWLTARRMRIGVPAAALALVALNPVVLRYGDSTRAYGFGALLLVLLFGAVWKFNEAPTRRRGAEVLALALLATHTLFYAGCFLLAMCVAAWVVSGRWRWGRSLALLGIGALCAASLAVYAPVIERGETWWKVAQGDVPWSRFFAKLGEAQTDQFAAAPLIWLALAVFAVLTLVALLRVRVESEEVRTQRRLAAFGVVTLVAATAVFFAFLKRAGLPTQTWYYLAFLAVAACGLDAALAARRGGAADGLRAVLLIAATLASAGSAVGASRERMTSADLLAQELSRQADAGDFILVLPPWAGITFDRYYSGAAPWQTAPAMADHKVNRIDRAMLAMATPDALGPLFDRAERTLAAGKRVWVVRGIPAGLPGMPAIVLPPAPHPDFGWKQVAYNVAWATQLDAFLAARAGRVTDLTLPMGRPVHAFESLTLQVAERPGR